MCIRDRVGAPLALAQDLGTKADVVAKTGSSPIVRPMDLVQMLVALAVVAWLLKWALPKVAGKLTSRAPRAAQGSIAVEESLALGTGQIQVVTVRGRTLLLSVSPTGTTFLTDLTANPPSLAPKQDEKAFFELLDGATGSHDAAVSFERTEQSGESGMSMDDALSLIASAKRRLESSTPSVDPLDRLNRLTGER